MKKIISLFLLATSFMLTGCGEVVNSSINSSPSSNSSETHEHVYKDTKVEPTFESQGYILHSCECGEFYKSDFTGILGEEESEDNMIDYRVLFIGNSYTFFNNSWDKFKNIAEYEGYFVSVDNVTQGGWTLQKMADENDSQGARVKEKLENNQYDLVFIQEQSLRPAIAPEIFFDSVRAIHKKIEDHGAKTILYETWGRKEGSSDLVAYQMDTYSMTQKLVAAYGAIGKELGIPVSHAGTAFYYIYTNYPEINLYNADLSHPSDVGSYLVALCHYATVYGKSPIGIAYKYYKNDEVKQSILEQAAHNAVFGESIVDEKYEMSSEGVTGTIDDKLNTIELAPEIPTEWVSTDYKVNLGSWDVSKDENGIAKFTNTSNKSMLMFKEELFAESGNIAFDLTTDNLFTGYSAQGIVYAANSPDIQWIESTASYYIIGRTRDGSPYATGIIDGAIDNISLISGVSNTMITDTTKTYRFNLVVDKETTLVYVDGSLVGVAKFSKNLTTGYMGVSSGINGKISVSNIQVNGKGLNVNIPEKEVIKGCKVNSGAASIVDGKIVTSEPKTTVMLTDVKVGDGSVIEFDLKSSTSYQAAYPQSIILGAANPDIIYTTSTDFYYAVGRMKNGKMGGYYVNGGSFNFGTEATDGTAVQVMQDVAKTYRIKVEIDYSVEGEETFVTYVDGVFARSFTFYYGFRGEYIGFTSAASGELEISNIVVDNVAYTLSNE